MSIAKNDAGLSIYPCSGKMVVSESTITAATSPVVVNVVGGLGGGIYRGNRGYIANDGAFSLLVEIALEGTNYMSQFTLTQGSNFDLTGMNISNIRLTRSGGDTAYRVLVW